MGYFSEVGSAIEVIKNVGKKKFVMNPSAYFPSCSLVYDSVLYYIVQENK